MKAADEMEVNDVEMPSVPILPNTESSTQAEESAEELFPDDEDTEMIHEDTEIQQQSI